jgi:methylase of polypeptide subunit release factors
MTNHETQHIDFGGLSVEFDDRVLRPRPWTIAQSYWAADLLRAAPAGPVLELCAGVGHIGLLAVAGTPRPLVLVDLDATACDFARANTDAARPEGPVQVRHGRVDTVLGDEERFVGIIADPPWVPSDGTGRFPDDPLGAIDGGPDGMDVAWACVDVAARHLADQGWLLLQLGTVGQADAVRERLAASPEPALTVLEVRDYEGQGVLVHLAARLGTDRSRPRDP